MPPALLAIAGLPGSGKTRLLARSGLDLALPDHLTHPDLWPGRLALLRDRLDAGLRVGVDGVNFGRRADRDRLADDLPGMAIEWTFFRPDRRACLINILYDSVDGGCRAGHHRLWSALGFDCDYPPGAEPVPVFLRPYRDGLLEDFLAMFPQCRRSEGKARAVLDGDG